MSFSSFLSSKLENDVRKLASGDIDALHGIYEQTKDSVSLFLPCENSGAAREPRTPCRKLIFA